VNERYLLSVIVDVSDIQQATQHATFRRSGHSGWVLTNAAVHEAFRRDLGQFLVTTASRRAVRARWNVFCDQLRFHLGTEYVALWPPVQVKLAGDPADLALVEAMEDEHRLIEPELAAIDEAFTVNASAEHLRDLLTRLQTTLSSHLAREEAEALPLINELMSQGELARITRTITRMGGRKRAAVMMPWALADASTDIRGLVLRQLPSTWRVLYRAVWLPRYRRNTPVL
jgi:hemerythrin HHE cation binding domain-containing protein